LTSSLDFEEVFEGVSHAAMDILDLDGAVVWTYEDGCTTVRTSVGEPAVPVGTTGTVSDAATELLMVQTKPLWIEDIATDDDVPDIIRSGFRTGSAILTPILVGDRVVGALSARSKQVRRFTEYDVRMLGRLAGQASVALDNAELHASIQSLSLTDSLTGLPNRNWVTQPQLGYPTAGISNSTSSEKLVRHIVAGSWRSYSSIWTRSNTTMTPSAMSSGIRF